VACSGLQMYFFNGLLSAAVKHASVVDVFTRLRLHKKGKGEKGGATKVPVLLSFCCLRYRPMAGMDYYDGQIERVEQLPSFRR